MRVGFKDVMLEGSKKLEIALLVQLSSDPDIRGKKYKKKF